MFVQDPANLKRYNVELNVSHANDLALANQRIDENAEAIEHLKAVIQRDLQSLQKKIETTRTESDQSASTAVNHNRHDSLQPLQEWRENFSKEELAEEYLGEADMKERMAVSLRKQAAEILGETVETKLSVTGNEHLEENNAQKSTAEVATTQSTTSNRDFSGNEQAVGFACCEIPFASLQELLTHVEQKHATPVKQAVLDDPFVDKESQQTSKIGSVDLKAVYPYGVAMMRPTPAKIPAGHIQTFTWDFLRSELGGEEWSPSFYFVGEGSILPAKAYWLLEADNEPFLPKKPGEHGAKLTPFFNETMSEPGKAPTPENYMNVPVFIRDKKQNTYRYYGNYSQLRFSDRVSFDDLMTKIPQHVRAYWADKLADTGRPEWVTQALVEHFWPRPQYNGPIPTDSATTTPATTGTVQDSTSGGIERRVINALEAYAEELKEWAKDTQFKTSRLNSTALYASFMNADASEEPGLRLWWEYLQCIGYDAGFYDFLLTIKGDARLSRSSGGSTGAPRPRTPGHPGSDIKKSAAAKFLTANGFLTKQQPESSKRNSNETDMKKSAGGPTPAKFLTASSVLKNDPETMKRDKTAHIANMSTEVKEKAVEASKKLTVWSKPQLNGKEPAKQLPTLKPVEKVEKVDWEAFGDLNAAKQIRDTRGKPPSKAAGKAPVRGGGGAGAGRGIPPHLQRSRW